jgi:hypothetical protein
MSRHHKIIKRSEYIDRILMTVSTAELIQFRMKWADNQVGIWSTSGAFEATIPTFAQRLGLATKHLSKITEVLVREGKRPLERPRRRWEGGQCNGP